ncbi:membrane protein insertase YidC [Halosquirtibacter xylanolyticus]|uniref:membrane protein insertase YidC n=1 Tax=Halosquirtibacter xylanolyticus TaxID=3374599 RepID=UPI0037483B8B|nr:membrane protein insertase YidC [Prolixibacteraceae bacterium]
MDKNTLRAFALIFLILIGSQYLMKPSEEELAQAQRQQDSIAALDTQAAVKGDVVNREKLTPASAVDDSARIALQKTQLGSFGEAVDGTESFVTLENNLMKVKLSTKGGRVYSVELKDYKRFDGTPLVLFDGDINRFGLRFNALQNGVPVETNKLFFTSSVNGVLTATGPDVPKGKEAKIKFNEENPGKSVEANMTLRTPEGAVVQYQYELPYNSYILNFKIATHNLSKVATARNGFVQVDWSSRIPRQEARSKYGEDSHTTVMYRELLKKGSGDVDDLGVSKDSEEKIEGNTEWIAFKQLFFSSILINQKGFSNSDLTVKTEVNDSTAYLGRMTAALDLPFDGVKENNNYNLAFYFGPNKYSILSQNSDLEFDHLIELGWGIFGWVNKLIVIPVFNFLSKYIGSYGIIILLLTIFIKLLIFPFTFKSYKSQAKMKALKPEIDEIQQKFGKEKAMESQQATMALYKKAGVNPMGGCIPMLFQMPIVIAMFRFFPVSIELRQQSFLWAHDLSTYDSIFHLPFTIPFYGDHVSLFCLLMTVTNILYMKYNSEMTGSSNAMPGMKGMMYMMPVMFLFMFNNYASGLSYYYFLSLLITFLQMFFVKRLINEDDIRAQIAKNKKKKVKKSKWQTRMEDMARQQQQVAKKKK